MSVGAGTADLPVGPLTKGLKAIFMQAYGEALKTSVLSKIATRVQSDSDSEDYPWLGAVPKMREFVGERQAKDLSNFNYNIKNKEWENTIGVKRSDIEDNKLGMLKMRIQELAQEAARYPEELALTMLKNALANPTVATYACYDGQGFFDTDHPAPNIIGGAPQDNLDAVALTYVNFWAAVHKMQLYQDDTGRYLNVLPNVLLVEPHLQETALEIAHSKFNVDTTNANVAMKDNMATTLDIEVIATPYLYTTATAANCSWILMDTRGVVKPLIYQDRTKVEFGSLEKESDTGFTRSIFQFGTRKRFNIGFGPWFRAYGSTGAG